jgi:hypothetical protein
MELAVKKLKETAKWVYSEPKADQKPLEFYSFLQKFKPSESKFRGETEGEPIP